MGVVLHSSGDWRLWRGRHSDLFQINDSHRESPMDTFDVRSTVSALNGGVIAVGALEIADPVSVHDFLMHSEFLSGGKHRFAILTMQGQIDVALTVMRSQVFVGTESLFATINAALDIVFLGAVRQLVLGETMLSNGGIFAMLTLQNRFRADVDLVSREHVIVQRILHVGPESAAFLCAIEASSLAMFAAHVILQRHRRSERLPTLAANMRTGFLFFLFRGFLIQPRGSTFSPIFPSRQAHFLVRVSPLSEPELLAAFTTKE